MPKQLASVSMGTKMRNEKKDRQRERGIKKTDKTVYYPTDIFASVSKLRFCLSGESVCQEYFLDENVKMLICTVLIGSFKDRFVCCLHLKITQNTYVTAMTMTVCCICHFLVNLFPSFFSSSSLRGTLNDLKCIIFIYFQST